MGKKTSKHFKPASINADRHNKREKDLSHVRHDLQPEDQSKWIWEAPNKKSIFAMRAQAEREYKAVEVHAKGKYGEYVTHKTMKKNAEPVKEAVVVIKEDTTLEEIKSWADWCHSEYGIRPVGIYIHLDEGHWGELDERRGQTEEMYRRTDGKEWKRLNKRGNIEYWKPNYHAHVVFDWFNHSKGRCINLGREVMSRMEDELAIRLKMERGTPSKAKHLNPDEWRAVKEKDRQSNELDNQIKKQKNVILDNDITIISQKEQMDRMDKETKLAEKRIKGLTTMLENLEYKRDAIQFEIDELMQDLGKSEAKNEEMETKLQKLQADVLAIEEKIEFRKEQLREATEKLERIQNKHAEASEDYNWMKREMLDEGKRLIQGTAWNVMSKEAKQLTEKFDDLKDEWPEIEEDLDEMMDGTFIQTVAERGNDVIKVAMLLYSGFVFQAVNVAEQSGGGGSTPGSDWGRKKDEDEESFRRRCLFASANMLQPRSSYAEEQNTKKSRKKGRHL